MERGREWKVKGQKERKKENRRAAHSLRTVYFLLSFEFFSWLFRTVVQVFGVV